LKRVLAVILLSVACGFAQQSGPPPAFQSPRGAFFALSVKNLDTTAGWYKEKLGFREVKQGASRDGTSRSIILDRDGVVLELIHHKQASSGTTLRKDYKRYLVFGVFKIGLIVDDADHTMQRLQANGVQIANGPWTDEELQMRAFFIRDNEGNIIQFLSKVGG
jgi:catechol 2,3-dioxygenase-like lactoylglutathione lyase family enzyme